MRRLAILLAVLAMPVLASPTTADASDAGGFQWGSAKACAVLSPTDVRCYPTEAAMEAATSGPRADDGGSSGGDATVMTASTTSAAYCAGRSDLWVYLYEHVGFVGRVIKFRDAGIWQNLTTWDFNDKASSWRNDTYCGTWLAEHTNGGGIWLWLPPRTSGHFYAGDPWNDRASSLHITFSSTP